MFYFNGRGVRNLGNDDFGWWLAQDSKSLNSSNETSSDSSSMVSCIGSEDENYTLANDYGQDVSKLDFEDLDLDLIEKDAVANTDTHPSREARVQIESSPEEKLANRRKGVCYTPERLVRSQEYRILTPSPRYLSVSQARITPEYENARKARRCRRRLSYLIDSKQVGANQLQALLNPGHLWRSRSHPGPEVFREKKDVVQDDSDLGRSFLVPDSPGKRSSYELFNGTWDEQKKLTTRSSSLEDTSGIQSNWSSDTHSDLQNSGPQCLCNELASVNFSFSFSQERSGPVNEVVSILDREPDKAAALLEEDRFSDSTSFLDPLSRLALNVGTNSYDFVSADNPEELVNRLGRKVQNLQVASKGIFKDIIGLRKDLQCDEERMSRISSKATKLREDLHEMRYLDDLLDLLQGELERISKRNWPFIVAHGEHLEEINLIV